MKSFAIVWATLARHLRPGALIRDAAMLVAIGSLAAFALLYAGRLSFDRVVWAAGLDYGSQSAGRQQGALVVTTAPGFSIKAATASDGPLDRTRDATTVVVYAAAASDQAAILYGPLVRAGRLDARGVLIDEATAGRLRARVGDTVELMADVDESSIRVPVSGIVAPFHLKGDYGNGGVVILPASALASGWNVAADPRATVTSYVASGSPTASTGQTKWRAVLDALSEEVSLGPFVVVVLALGLGLWLVGVSRAAGDLVRSLHPHLSLVVALGRGPRTGRAFGTLVVVAIAASAASLAAASAYAFITAWTGFYVSHALIGGAVAALTLVAWVAARGAHVASSRKDFR